MVLPGRVSPTAGRARGSRLAVLASALTCALVLLLAAPSARALTVRTDADKKTALLDVMEAFVPRAESFWTRSNLGVARTDFFDADGDGVSQPRGAGAIAFVYATLLTARPAQATFGPTRVTRATMIDHVEQTIRHEAYTNDLLFTDPDPTRDPYEWGSGEWQASPMTYNWGWAAQLLWNDFVERRDGRTTGDDTRAKVTQIVQYEADYLLRNKVPETITDPGDTEADPNSWNTGLLAAAAAMYPRHRDVRAWTEHAKDYAVNSSTIDADRSSTRLIDGVQLRDWASTVNLNDDLTLFNHGFFHPVYAQGVFQMLSDSMMFFESVGYAIPEAFTFRLAEIWDGVLAELAYEDGELLHPVGTDWVAHDMQHISYLALVATWLGRHDASALESVAIERVGARQAATRTGSLYGMPEIGYEAENVRTYAVAWWLHELFGPSPTSTQGQVDTARAASAGVHEYPDAELVTHRTDDSLNTISWSDADSAEPAGQIVPAARDHAGDEVFTRAIPKGMWGLTPGAVQSHSCECTSDSFSAAAISGASSPQRFMSMTSFPDGSALLLDRGTGTVGSTFRFGFEYIDGMTGPRPVTTNDGVWEWGDGAVAPSGNWFNVADRFGLAVAGGAGIGIEEIGGTSPYIEIEGSRGAGSGNRGAIALPLATAAQTALLAPFVSQPTVSDSLWSAVTARGRDGAARIAVGRWGGAGTATISNMTSPFGAPIPDRPNDVAVNGRNGSTSVTLGSPASTGWYGYFWVESTNAVTVRPISESRIRITNGGSSSTVTVRYVKDGVVHVAQATLAANAVAFGRELNEGVAIATPSASSSAGGQPASLVYDGDTGTQWASASTRISAGSPQTLTIDYGAPMDMGGAVMTPVSGAGPRDYVVQTSPDGTSWTNQVTERGIGNSARTSTFASAVKARYLRLSITASNQAGDPTQVKVSELRFSPPTIDADLVDPLATAVIAGDPQLRIARGGYAEATVRLRNAGGSATNVTVGASGLPTGVTAAFSPAGAVSVPAGGTADVKVRLTASGTAATSGTTDITITATSAASETLELAHTDNLALNGLGTAFPRALSETTDTSMLYLPSLGNDGDTAGASNFWVSAGVPLGAGAPECLVIDLGASVTVGRAVMTPRTNYGPRDFKVQTSTANTTCLSETGWTTRDTRTGVTNGSTITSTWTPAAARYVRLRITATHGSGPPYWTQVRELALHPS
jgi:hypothetical protein